LGGEPPLGQLLKQHRLTRDEERHPVHAEAFIYLTMLWLMLHRLAKLKQK